MLKLWATISKELLMLWRDRAGLLILFVMPAALVLVISLVQDNVLRATGESTIEVLLVDQDDGWAGQFLREALSGQRGIILVEELNGEPLTEAAGRAAVSRGEYQFCTVVPGGTTQAIKSRALQLAVQSFRGQGALVDEAVGAGESSTTQMALYTDPAVRETLRLAVVSALDRAVFALETEEKLKGIAQVMPAQLQRILHRKAPMAATALQGLDEELKIEWNRQSLLSVAPRAARDDGREQMPNAVQQNVPAWTLFGMFFIVVPLSGTLIRERQEGTLLRLGALPISRFSILGGKVAAYVLVCSLQCLIMLMVGLLLLPRLGTPVLNIGDAPAALLVLALCAALAATGYGLMVGSVARSYEQASMFGAVSVVIAAALGGIMVPVYVMPPAMQGVGSLSPLGWGLSGFQEIFVRGGSLASIWPQALLLFTFFVVTLLVSGLSFTRSGTR
ncbi:MAG: ABC transporter permease [Gammaproteobacteria bacterium]|nr:ABC transporter permease [Desulfuromonadales bacterium]NIT64864.1 ABC transporter permease [Gammaproteobacteria bacterium]NIY33444.1 ABC transporter permease [Gammaproteobacteria bacterium]